MKAKYHVIDDQIDKHAQEREHEKFYIVRRITYVHRPKENIITLPFFYNGG